MQHHPRHNQRSQPHQQSRSLIPMRKSDRADSRCADFVIVPSRLFLRESSVANAEDGYTTCSVDRFAYATCSLASSLNANDDISMSNPKIHLVKIIGSCSNYSGGGRACVQVAHVGCGGPRTCLRICSSGAGGGGRGCSRSQQMHQNLS